MATRKRRPMVKKTSPRNEASRKRLRRNLLETLEPRQLLAAGPQLIGIQPNEGALIDGGSPASVDPTVLGVAPRTLTFRFDDNQAIHPNTLDAIQITRAGSDGLLGTMDDVRVQPGSVLVGNPDRNEVIVRFSEKLPDDRYRIEVFAFDDPAAGVVGLRNTAPNGTPGDLLITRGADAQKETREFDLRLGALVESVVPQPVVRLADGTLQQRRDEVVVYFNEPLFIESDPATGLPSDRSADNPRFYQLLYTRDTTRNTDDTLFLPVSVDYDVQSQTATLVFAKDLERLIRENVPNGGVGGGTFRLRLGSAVNLPTGVDGTLGVPTFTAGDPAGSIDLFFEPDTTQQFVASARSTLRTTGQQTTTVEFTSVALGQGEKWNQVRFEDSGSGGMSVNVMQRTSYFDVVVDLGGALPLPTVQEVVDAINAAAASRLQASIISGDGSVRIGSGLPAVDPVRLLSDSFDTSHTVGSFGGEQVTSLLFSETISQVPYGFDLNGGPNDPASRDLIGRTAGVFADYINRSFSVNHENPIKTIEYNFGSPGAGRVNSITAEMKSRVRESLDLWSQHLGVRFVETLNDGWTIALESPSAVPSSGSLTFNGGLAAVVPDASFNDGLLVLDALHDWEVGYGEDFFRNTFAGIGALLGLGQASDLPASTVMALSNAFLNGTIDQSLGQMIYNQVGSEFSSRPLEPIFGGNYDILHGQYLHGAVGSDIDLYRFEVDVTTGSNTGLLTVETFAQRLPDSSTLDTSIKVFQETQASIETNFSMPVAPVKFEAIAPGKLGNQTTIEFVRSYREYTPPSDALTPAEDQARRDANELSHRVIIVQTGSNSFTVDIPYLPELGLLSDADRAAEIEQVGRTPADIIRTIQSDAFSAKLVRAIDQVGDGFAMLDDFAMFEPILSQPQLAFTPLVLTGGDIQPVAFNDDYFGTDSRIQIPLGNGVYYIGVAASGNDQYDAVIAGTGFGGKSVGDYQLFVKFEANADGRDTIRDLDSGVAGTPGTSLDGDGDGVPGGAHNFWFQVRPEQRQIQFDSGASIVPGSTMTLVGGPNGVTKTYQFILVDAFDNALPGQPSLGNGRIAIRYRDVASSVQIAQLVTSVINGQTAASQVSATVIGTGVGANIVVLDNERSLSFSSNFRGGQVYGRTLFVDKTASAFPDGTTSSPFNNIASTSVPSAFRVTHPGDIVRIVSNGGNDRKIETGLDNFAYRIGTSETGGAPLEDGSTFDVPKGVTVMVDAGVVLKMRNARLGVGSSNLQLDRSGAALQILGTPRLLSATGELLVYNGQAVPGTVVMTSTRDQSVARTSTTGLPAGKGDWGGVVFRRDVDDTFGRFNLEDQGIFLNTVNQAEIRYGGGSNILEDANQITVNPIQIVDTKPTITFNRIMLSADAAMSAAPNSFEEISYQSPRYQSAGAFTADYDRVGPDIRNNTLSDNSLNGLFIRVETRPGEAPIEQVVSGRWDDTDIVHILTENLVLSGNAGGAIRDGIRPSLNLVTSQVIGDAGAVGAGSYFYRLTMVDRFGFESLASNASNEIVVAGPNSQISLAGLPQVPASSGYLFRRLYRSNDGVNFSLVAELNANATTYVDRLGQSQSTSRLDLSRVGERGRPTSSLSIDPGTVVKIQGSRIEVGFGAQLLAEGVLGKETIFTSLLDDRFGAGGSFDTNNDGQSSTPQAPRAADWAGIYVSPSAHLSLDSAVVAYAGGLSRIEGTFKAFSPIELQQATARIVNTSFENNADGIGGQGPTGRYGRLANTPSTIFVRGSQPIVVGNTFVDNEGSVLDVDANSLNADLNVDVGRQTGDIDRIVGLDDNRGPLVRRNLLDDNDLNGMEIRGATLTTESVWDDTDIVHVLYDSIIVGNFHGSGGLRLQSNPNESLVIKLLGQGSPFSDTTGTGITITGRENDVTDRIGGTVNVLGRPGFPVVLTSLRDDSVGAGRKPDGTQLTDTNNDAWRTRPEPNDWRSVFLDQTSNDRNISVQRELELQTDQAPGLNGIPATAQVLGDLAGRLVEGDDLYRLGFDVEGFISSPADVDVYQFRGEAGTEVWIDIDRTTQALDSVVELLDANGTVLARSSNSANEVFNEGAIETPEDLMAGRVGSLAKGPRELLDFSGGGEYYDFDSANPRDAGLRVVLPGAVGNRGPYFIRIRSNSVNPDDASGGLTSGLYRVQLRLGEAQEFAGSSIQYADIRYANHGVHTKGLPGSSPLLGDAQENESVSAISANNQIDQDPSLPGVRPQYLGNLLAKDNRTVSVGGSLSSAADIDFYRIELDAASTGVTAGGVIAPAVFDIDYADGISRPDTNMAIYYSPTGSAASARLVLFGRGSNVSEDRTGFLSSLSEDIFNAGSTGAGDPFVGPVALPEGTYFVGITHGSRVPSALSDTLNVRREPVNSVARIIEERFYGPGDTVVRTTAQPPVVPSLFDTTALPAGFVIDSSRGNNSGHGIPAAFDGSRPATAGGRSLRFNPALSAPSTTNSVTSTTFSLAGYSAEDLPTLYFNYLFSGAAGDSVRLEVVSGSQVTPVASSTGANAAIVGGTAWRQAIVPLGNLAFRENLQLRVTYLTGTAVTGEGFFIDDIVLGFAERGEMILGATPGDSSFDTGFSTGITSGEYQLEVRPGTDYFNPTSIPGRQIVLTDAFDTNDRHASSITMLAPAGSDLQDGMYFQLGDGSSTLTFEFDELTATLPNGNGVGFGNIRIPFRSIDSSAKVGAALRTAINSAVTQNGLRISASTAFGGITTNPSDERINLYGTVTGDFISINEATSPTSIPSMDPLRVRMPARFSNGIGDSNAERAQGQVFIENSTISDVKVYGIWSDPGDRLVDDTDDVPLNPYLENRGLHSPALGAIRNLPTANSSVLGGLAPGLIIQNNVIDQAGYVGILLQGELRPFMFEAPLDGFNPNEDLTANTQRYLGARIPDGYAFAIDAGGTRVVFEFEDISGANAPSAGSTQIGGDGWTAGHVPVYYRKGFEAAGPYNGPPNNRVYASTRMEVMHAIRDAINSSILVTNDLVPLVDTWVGPSLTDSVDDAILPITTGMAFPTATLFVNGASGIYFTTAYSKGGAGPVTAPITPVQEAVQPFARVINNTIYGADGTESNFPVSGLVEPSEQISSAIDTKLGLGHNTTAYTTTARLGDSGVGLPAADVDMYRVQMAVGERLRVNLSTGAGGPRAVVRLFNSRGEAQQFPGANGTLVDKIDTGASPGALAIDFTAVSEDSYYIGVSSMGNDAYDPKSFADRVPGFGGTGNYQLSMDVLTAKQFVLSLQQVLNFDNLIGTTFTIEQVADLAGTNTNRRTFEFVAPGGGAASGNVPIPVRGGNDYRTSDVMRGIAAAINSSNLLNHQGGNGPGGVTGPIGRVSAVALGGVDGWDNDSGLTIYDGGIRGGVVYPLKNAALGAGFVDSQNGFGHNRTSQVGSTGTGTTDGAGVGENYVLIKNASRVIINNVPNLGVDPQPGRNMNQLLPEVGVLIRSGASPSLMNNVILNTQAAIENEVSRASGFGVTRGNNQHPKPGQVIVGGSIFQHTESVQGLFTSRMTWPGGQGSGTETDSVSRPSNVNAGADDFNMILPGSQILLVNPGANQFTPAPGSIAIDSAINSLAERDAFASLKQALGLPVNPLLAPTRDVTGQLRVDDPSVFNTGIGSVVFKDRGGAERADFVGPVAVIINPFDNDASGSDLDPNVSYVQVESGIVSEFRIQLRDSGDASDPFQGSGVDDGSVVGPFVAGVRQPGAALTLFENGRMLEEGIDYRFSYDETNNVITLRPLAGIWRQESIYEIELNNQDRFVATAPAGRQVADGDQFVVFDDQGGRVTFEYDAGYQIEIPEVVTLRAPAIGTGAGGVSDGDRVVIRDGNRSVTFEYTTDLNSIQAGNVPVLFALSSSPEQLIDSLQVAIQSKITDGTFTTTIPAVGVRQTITLQKVGTDGLRIGMEQGGIANASSSGLIQASRTLALQTPLAGVGPGGVVDGDLFVISDGVTSLTFEFDQNGIIGNNRVPVSLLGITQPSDVIRAIADAIDASGIRARHEQIGTDLLYLGLPEGGQAEIISGRLAAVSYARTLADAGTITLTPQGGSAVVIELNRTDEYSGNDSVATGNVAVNFTRTTGADELSSMIASAIRGQAALGLSPTSPGSGILLIDGDETLELSIASADNLLLTAQPGVANSTTLRIFGPLLLQTPLAGGNGTPDGSSFSITSNGITETFAFNLTLTPVDLPNAIQINYTQLDTSDDLALRIANAITGSALGITATVLPGGRVSLGQLQDSAVDLNDSTLDVRRGIVQDGEKVSITQDGVTLVFEFEEATSGGGVVAGAYPVLFSYSDSTNAVAVSLTAAINQYATSLGITATNLGNGEVRLADTPRTRTDISAAPTLSLSGVAGGAIPVPFVQAASFSSEDLKRSLITAINSVGPLSANPITTLSARDRGGDTFFIENAVSIEQPMVSFYLPAVTDVVGLPLKANREDGTTRFTLMLPTVEFDYGDAPDPQGLIRGRYPTMAASDGARHILGSGLVLGTTVDPELNGQPLSSAAGDDTAAYVVGMPSASLTFNRTDTTLTISVGATAADGHTIRIATVTGVETFEIDSNNIFSEDNIPVRIQAGDTPELIAQRLAATIKSSSIRPSNVVASGTSVTVMTNDDDGVRFDSTTNPFGVFNPNIATQITVNVTGKGYLDGWVDFNADGDWDDPNEQIFASVYFDGIDTQRTFSIPMPSTAPVPSGALETYARFRVSSGGNLRPAGLAIDGEVEDYQVLIVPGSPPVVATPQISYTVDEGQRLIGLDPDGSNTPSSNDNGVLAGVVDPDGDAVIVYPVAGVETINGVEYGIVGVGTTSITRDGKVGSEVVGTLTLNADGRFTFDSTADYFGPAVFRVRVMDSKPAGQENLQLVSPQLLTVSINVNPVNDAPRLIAGANPTTTINDSPEDQVVTLTSSELINGRFEAGPANESDQGMVVQSAGFGGVPNVTRRGGTLQISSNGTVIYTPPLNFNGPGTDEFVYTVVDIPAAGQSPQQSTDRGTVVISFVPVNDPPVAGSDTYAGVEDTDLEIPINGVGGILANDSPGPADEEVNQFVSLVMNPSQFPLTTVRGGTVRLSSDNLKLIYTPARNFAGSDSFQYRITDNAPGGAATALGTVTIVVDGRNDGAVYGGPTTLTYNESKGSNLTYEIDLNTWFTDPEGDALSYQATSGDTSLVQSVVIGNLLRLTLPQDRSGNTVITVTAVNPGNTLPVSANINVVVNNIPDPPRRIQPLSPVNTNEDQTATRDLTQYFVDPDGDVLQYSVVTPSGQTDPFDRTLVKSVSFNGDQMVITVMPNAYGSTNITIRVSDGSFAITETFTLNVAPVADLPVANNDSYSVSLRGRLIVNDPRLGLLGNDTEADGDLVSVDLASVSQPLSGTVIVNTDGTFTYTNLFGTNAGPTDVFTYRAIDKDGRSVPATVTINITSSSHQNPNRNLDVTADNVVTPIDALRIINLMNRRGSTSIPVRDLPAPPDFFDTDGNGLVTPLDALAVINHLQRAGSGEGEGFDLRLGTTTAWVSAATANLPQSRVVRSDSSIGDMTTGLDGNVQQNRNVSSSASWQIVDNHLEDAIELLACTPGEPEDADSRAADEAIVDLLTDFSFGPMED